MIGSWVTGGLAATSIMLGAVAWYQTMRLDTATSELALKQGELTTCGGLLNGVLRDVESDNKIDDIDLLNFDVPSDWMRPTGPGGD